MDWEEKSILQQYRSDLAAELRHWYFVRRPFLEAWDYLHQTVASHQPVGRQLPLFQ